LATIWVARLVASLASLSLDCKRSLFGNYSAFRTVLSEAEVLPQNDRRQRPSHDIGVSSYFLGGIEKNSKKMLETARE
jgi:hypothetical protein